MNESLQTYKRLYPEIGWIAPDGTYYCAVIGDSMDNNRRLHFEIGEAIIRHFYPELIAFDGDGIPGMMRLHSPYESSGGIKDVLYEKEYVKIDLEQITSYGDYYTRAQLDTMFDLYHHKEAGRLPTMREAIRKVLVKQGFEFLSRPGDEHPDTPVLNITPAPQIEPVPVMNEPETPLSSERVEEMAAPPEVPRIRWFHVATRTADGVKMVVSDDLPIEEAVEIAEQLSEGFRLKMPGSLMWYMPDSTIVGVEADEYMPLDRIRFAGQHEAVPPPVTDETQWLRKEWGAAKDENELLKADHQRMLNLLNDLIEEAPTVKPLMDAFPDKPKVFQHSYDAWIMRLRAQAVVERLKFKE